MDFCVARIVGNELPPRDSPGDRVKILSYIIENEVRASCLKKIWIINRIFDSELLKEVRALLEGQAIFEIPFKVSEYKPLDAFYYKLQYITNINAARNYAINKSRELRSDFFFIFDGDCFLSEDQFTYIKNMLTPSSLDVAYGIPTIRTLGDSSLNESMPVIGKAFFEYFDESIPFGYNEKIAFLSRNKIKDIPGATCFHKSFSREDIERDFKLRGIERFRSINQFIDRLDKSLRTI